MQGGKRHQSGFTLVDTLIGALIFVLVGVVVFQAYSNLMRIVSVSSERVAASSILQEELEIIKNIPFTNLGLEAGIPPGTLQPTKTIIRNNKTYEITTSIRNVDDPFDGVIGNNLEDVRLQYSAQVGEGGLTMEGNSTVYGNVFSNGDVIGSTASEITEDVWVSNGYSIQSMEIYGDAHANSISDSVIHGDAYYQSISNTTVDGTNYPGSTPPSPQTLPIADSSIADWKTEASSFGSMGSVSLTGSDSLTLGPIKINGDLDMRNNSRLTITGTVWVTGDVTLRNSSAIDLDSSYSSASGVIIADGKISIEQSVQACGSEGYNSSSNDCNTFSGSYLVLITTNGSQSTSDPAVDMQNSSGFRGILYSNTGLIYVHNNSNLVEATAYAVRIGNGSTVSYGTGLYNLLITGNPGVGDTSPGDYRLIEVTVTCLDCAHGTSISGTTTIAPKDLETTAGNGALLVQVFDAVGQPVQSADVLIVNTTTAPLINYADITDINGQLLLIDVPPAEQSYEITVTKTDYSEDKTLQRGEPSNPNPLKPHATVVADSVTQLSFSIDKLSTLDIETVDQICTERGAIDFDLSGAKFIGLTPDVLKYEQSHTTDGQGLLSLANMEWDTYSVALTDSQYYLSGSLPSLPMQLSPDTTQTLSLVVELQTTNALLIEVIDAVSGLPVEDATVDVLGPGYSNTLTTGEGHWQQTDWSGGPGQEYYSDATRFHTWNNTLDYNAPAGELKLEWNGSSYSSSGSLTSSIFDNASSTNFYHLITRPQGQPVETGTDPIRIQIASTNNTSTWDYLGPDGTSGTYYTPNDNTLNAVHNGDRFIRYQITLQTEDTDYTPNVSDIAISFANECSPSGQVYFNDVNTGSNTITVSKSGYITNIVPYTVVSGWQSTIIELTST